MTRTPDWRDVALADRDEDMRALRRTLGYVGGCLVVALSEPDVPRRVHDVLNTALRTIESNDIALDGRQRARRERDAAGYGSAPECAGGGA